MPSVPSKFLALRIHEEDEKTQARLERISLEELTEGEVVIKNSYSCLLYTSPSPRDYAASRMPSSA